MKLEKEGSREREYGNTKREGREIEMEGQRAKRERKKSIERGGKEEGKEERRR